MIELDLISDNTCGLPVVDASTGSASGGVPSALRQRRWLSASARGLGRPRCSTAPLETVATAATGRDDGVMNSDQVIAVVGIGSVAAVGLTSSLLLFFSNRRAVKAQREIAQEGRHEERLKEAYSDLYQSMFHWHTLVSSVVKALERNEKPTASNTIKVSEVREQAQRTSFLWSADVLESFNDFQDACRDVAMQLYPNWTKARKSSELAKLRKSLDRATAILDETRSTMRAEFTNLRRH